jgi:hypothetical protein
MRQLAGKRDRVLSGLPAYHNHKAMRPANQTEVIINHRLPYPLHHRRWRWRWRWRSHHHHQKQNHCTPRNVAGVDPHLNLLLLRRCKSSGGAVPPQLLALGFLARFLPGGCLAYQIANCAFSFLRIFFLAARIVPSHSL